MFEIVKEFMEQFFDMLPVLTVMCLLFSILGSLTFRR